MSEFHIPLLHEQPASLLDYLPQKSLVLIDDLSVVESMVAEVEEQAVKLRNESIQEETLTADFPLPYITWPDLLDNFHSRPFLELGYSTQLEGDEESEDRLSSQFSHDERFGGRLKQFIDYLVSLFQKGEETIVISRQSNRLHELWQERSVEEESSDSSNIPDFTEASLSEGFILRGDETVPPSDHRFGSLWLGAAAAAHAPETGCRNP